MTHFLPVGTTLSRGDSVTVHCIVSFSCACSCMHSQTTAGTFFASTCFPLVLCISTFETRVFCNPARAVKPGL